MLYTNCELFLSANLNNNNNGCRAKSEFRSIRSSHNSSRKIIYENYKLINFYYVSLYKDKTFFSFYVFSSTY